MPLLVAIAIAACASPADEPRAGQSFAEVVREIDAAGVEVVISPAPSWSSAEQRTVSAEPLVAIGVEAGAKEYMLSNVGGAVRLADGRIVIADGDGLELRTYDSSGRYLGAIGREGSGPGEFGYLFGVLNCVGDELWAMVLPRALSRFDVDGNFIDLLRITVPEGGTPYNHACNAAGQHLTIGWGMPRSGLGVFRTRTRAWLLSPEGEELADLGEVFGSERLGTEGGSGPHDYGRQTVLALNERRAYIGEADDFEVREHDLDGNLVRRIRWQGHDLTLDPAEIERYKAWVTETEQLDPRSRRAQGLLTMEFPPTAPAYTELQLDPVGNLWVRSFSAPGIDQERWWVFGEDGRWLGTVEAPIGLGITQIGVDFILGIYRDELDTEFVQMYRLS